MQRFLADTVAIQYAEESRTDVLTAPGVIEPPDGAVHLLEATDTRRVIDTAVGILMELRRCSEREAIAELVLAAREAGSAVTTLAQGLKRLPEHGTSNNDPNIVAAQRRWRHVLAARAKLAPAGGIHRAALRDDVTVRYGGLSDLTRC